MLMAQKAEWLLIMVDDAQMVNRMVYNGVATINHSVRSLSTQFSVERMQAMFDNIG